MTSSLLMFGQLLVSLFIAGDRFDFRGCCATLFSTAVLVGTGLVFAASGRSVHLLILGTRGVMRGEAAHTLAGVGYAGGSLGLAIAAALLGFLNASMGHPLVIVFGLFAGCATTAGWFLARRGDPFSWDVGV